MLCKYFNQFFCINSSLVMKTGLHSNVTDKTIIISNSTVKDSNLSG